MQSPQLSRHARLTYGLWKQWWLTTSRLHVMAGKSWAPTSWHGGVGGAGGGGAPHTPQLRRHARSTSGLCKQWWPFSSRLQVMAGKSGAPSSTHGAGGAGGGDWNSGDGEGDGEGEGEGEGDGDGEGDCSAYAPSMQSPQLSRHARRISGLWKQWWC